MTEKQRTALLGAVSFVLLAFLGVKLLSRGGSSDEPVGVAKREGGASVTPVGSITHGHASEIEKRYRPILDADPFRVRNFLRKRDGARSGGDVSPISSDLAPPGMVTLRLTAVVADRSGCLALLEDRSSGSGIFVHTGDKLGDRQIAEVRSASIVLDAIAPLRSNVKVIEFNDRVDVKRDDIERHLKKFTVSTAPVASNAPPAQEVTLTPEQHDDIIKRLKEKARRSRGENADVSTDTSKPK